MKHTILCIDDETHNLEALERLLRKKYSIVTANSGVEGIEALKSHDFSLIISDQKMPEMTGVEFFMKAKEIQPEAIRILLTGYTDLESVISAINQGQIYRYITKPWEPEEFLSTTQQALDVFEMKNTIALQNTELQKANEELKSLDKMKSDFMMLVNHELKTPLTGIFSYVQLLSEEKLQDDHRLYINKISQNTQRLQDLIEDTLLITRLQTGQKNQESTALDIAKLIRTQWDQSFQKNPKQLDLKLINNDAFIQNGNEKYLNIIIKKLLQNCIDHGKSDSTVEAELIDIESSWTLRIKNQMTQAIDKSLDQLVSAFSTSENILNHSGGTGLGLAVIQGIVNLFGGQIDLATDNLNFDLKIQIPKDTSA